MTRKRYVKLLMSEGYSRNLANITAANANRKGIAYADAPLKPIDLATLNLPDVDFSSVIEAFKNVSEAALKITKALAKGLAAFSETVTKELAET